MKILTSTNPCFSEYNWPWTYFSLFISRVIYDYSSKYLYWAYYDCDYDCYKKKQYKSNCHSIHFGWHFGIVMTLNEIFSVPTENDRSNNELWLQKKKLIFRKNPLKLIFFTIIAISQIFISRGSFMRSNNLLVNFKINVKFLWKFPSDFPCLSFFFVHFEYEKCAFVSDLTSVFH